MHVKRDPLSISMRLHLIVVAFVLAFAAGCQTVPGGPDKPDIRWLGIAQRRETDFDRRTWDGTPVRLVGRLLEGLPDRIDSAAEHKLARNILVTTADAPPGDEDSSFLVAVRVAKLMRMGNFADAAALGRAAPSLASDKEVAQDEAEAELLAGELEMACIDLRALAQREASRWVEDGAALCKARAGELGALPPTESEDLGVLVRIDGGPLPSALPAASIAESAAIAQDPKLSPARRLDDAFAAARASAIDGGAFARILRAAPARGRLPAGPPMSGADATSLFHAIEDAGDPARKLALAENGLLSSDGVVDQVSVALTMPLRTVRPSADLAPLSVRFARLFYAIGDGATARGWADLAVRSGQGAALWPYRAILGQAKTGESEKWLKHVRLAAGRQERVLAIVAAFGAVPSDGVLQAADRPASVDPTAMNEAATSQRVGETTLRALALLGPEGPGRTDPEALRQALADLDRVNLRNEAHALAFEALAAALPGG